MYPLHCGGSLLIFSGNGLNTQTFSILFDFYQNPTPMESDHAQHSVVWFYGVPCLPYSMFKVTAKDAILPF